MSEIFILVEVQASSSQVTPPPGGSILKSQICFIFELSKPLQAQFLDVTGVTKAIPHLPLLPILFLQPSEHGSSSQSLSFLPEPCQLVSLQRSQPAPPPSVLTPPHAIHPAHKAGGRGGEERENLPQWKHLKSTDSTDSCEFKSLQSTHWLWVCGPKAPTTLTYPIREIGTQETSSSSYAMSLYRAGVSGDQEMRARSGWSRAQRGRMLPRCTHPSWGPSPEIPKAPCFLELPPRFPALSSSSTFSSTFSYRLSRSPVPGTLHHLIILLVLKGQ